jgi:uncharacterized protein YdaU (DUF1376 family)
VNYFELHIGDYESATAHLSILEDGIYTRLMRVYYRTEAPLPLDLEQTCRLIRVAKKSEKNIVKAVLTEFFVEHGDGWHNDRCDEEVARFQVKQDKARRSANARWGNVETDSERNANASADAMRTHSEGNAPRARPQTPDTSKEQKHSLRSLRADDDPAPDWTPETSPGFAAFEAHFQHLRKWSAARRMLALGQLRAIAANGGDPETVLTWATSRGLADLADAARRMAADAAKELEDGQRRRSGESLADASRRQSDERLAETGVGLIPLTGTRAG